MLAWFQRKIRSLELAQRSETALRTVPKLQTHWWQKEIVQQMIRISVCLCFHLYVTQTKFKSTVCINPIWAFSTLYLNQLYGFLKMLCAVLCGVCVFRNLLPGWMRRTSTGLWWFRSAQEWSTSLMTSVTSWQEHWAVYLKKSSGGRTTEALPQISQGLKKNCVVLTNFY